MKLLVTGATGFLGYQLVEKLVERGEDVRCLVRQREARIPKGATVAHGDIRDPETLLTAAENRDIVIHCAALLGGRAPKEEFFAVNAGGTRNMLQAAAKASVKRFIHISTTGVLGCVDHDGTDETAPLIPSDDPYRDSKLAAEEAVRKSAYADTASIIRPGWIYGPGERNAFPQLLKRLESGKMVLISGGKNLIHPVYVCDVVDAVLACVDREVSTGQTYNITCGKRTTMADFLSAFARAAGVSGRIWNIPYFVGFSAALAGSFLGKILRRRLLVNLHTLRLLTMNSHFSIEKAKKQLDFRPLTDFEQGLRVFIEEYRRSGRREVKQ
jgi:nucleoside-diphosphate-sugar epimerase